MFGIIIERGDGYIVNNKLERDSKLRYVIKQLIFSPVLLLTKIKEAFKVKGDNNIIRFLSLFFV